MSEYQKLNTEVKKWSLQRARQMNYLMNSLGIHDTGRLFMALRSKVDEYFGKASVIRFKFPRYGVFVEKGVGRGYPIESVKTNAASLNAASKRVAKPWFSNAIQDRDIDELAAIVGTNYENINVKKIKQTVENGK